MDNSSKTIIIVGASGSIGNKTSELLLEQGYSVIGTYFQHPTRVDNLLKYDNFESLQFDISNVESVEEFHKKISRNIFAIVNNSGILNFEGKGIEKDIQIWDKTIATNFSGNYYLARIFIDNMENNGRFIMTSSTDALYGGTVTAAYAASKIGINSLTKSLSLMFKEKKVLVNTVAPGWVITNMTKGEGQEFLDEVAGMNPLKRNAMPIDIAKVIRFLVSEDASYINGQVISIEGGLHKPRPYVVT
ncbi:MAG: SDR family oxidoreductase [Patescibacteria group bacterium]